MFELCPMWLFKYSHSDGSLYELYFKFLKGVFDSSLWNKELCFAVRMAFALLFTIIAAADDIRRYKISNRISLMCCCIAVVLFGIEGIVIRSFEGMFQNYLIGGVTVFLIMFAAYIIKAVGAGDVKLSGALGLLVGGRCMGRVLILAFLYTAAAGLAGILLGKCAVKEIPAGRVHTIHFSVAMLFGEFIVLFAG